MVETHSGYYTISIFKGVIGSRPYNKKNGEKPVEVATVEFIANSAIGNLSTQSSSLSIIQRSTYSSVRCYLSVPPLL
jgi:hypothetical protein